MRMRRRSKSKAEAAVMMSPLIDCVFLLLIFFLVTSIIKRYERQIPVTLADPTAAVATEGRSDALRLGLSTSGQLYRDEAGLNLRAGAAEFVRVADVSALVAQIIERHGPDMPVEVVVEQETPFQTVIDLLDRLQHAGLTTVRSRVRDGKI